MDAHAVTHPTDETLNSYGLGKLDDRSAAGVNKHLERCADCRKRVAELSADSFLGRIRGAQKPAGHSMSDPSQPGAAKSHKSTNGPSPPPAHTLPPGLADHPDYEIKRELGRGGMGVVYLAHNTLMGRDEVLKVMGRQIMDSPDLLERFLREIRAVAKLRHPNIVTAYHATRIGDSIVFAMEFVEGYDLAQLVKARGSLPVALACNFAYQAALGLQHAHEEGLVHRDIKPGNLMLSRNGDKATVKVLDFGLAKATREEKVDGALTSDGQALGTPDFIAPEQILNAPSADIRADIYSLGATLYYLLAGRPPFPANSLYDVYQGHISRDAGPLNLVRPEVPAALAALVAKMMAKDPVRRFQIPAEVAQSLTPFFRQRNGAFKRPVSPIDQSIADHAVTNVISGPTDPEIAAEGASFQSKRRAVPDVAKVRWESLIELGNTEHSNDSEPVVASVRRAASPPWVVAIAVFVLGAFALGVMTIRSWNGGTRIAAKGDQSSKAPPADKPKTPASVAKTSSPVTDAEVWVSLFNGKDKTGWKTHPSQPDNWRVKDGVLMASGPEISHLYSDRGDYKDFRLRVQARVDDGASGGVHARSGFGPARPKNQPMFPVSYEAAVNCTHPNPNKTGSLYLPEGNPVNCPESPVPPGEWMILEMIARGRHIVVKVNGNVTTAYHEDGASYPRQGHIALLRYPRLGAQPYRPETLIQFRKIEIKELNGERHD